MKYLIVILLLTTACMANAQKDSVLVTQRKARNDSIYKNRFNQKQKHIGFMPMLTFSVGDEPKYRLFGAQIEGGYFIKKKLLAFVSNRTSYSYEKQTDITTGNYYNFNTLTAPGLRYYLAARKWTVFGQGQFYYSIENGKASSNLNKAAQTYHTLGGSVGLGMTLCFNWLDIAMHADYLFPFYVNTKPEPEYNWEYWNTGLQLGLKLSLTF